MTIAITNPPRLRVSAFDTIARHVRSPRVNAEDRKLPSNLAIQIQIGPTMTASGNRCRVTSRRSPAEITAESRRNEPESCRN
jgi:hypothetical protein